MCTSTNSIMEKLAEQTNESHIICNGKNSEIVIGAPHHAPRGVKRLPCDRPADQNTGYIALYLAELLGCSTIISTNATMDPNKKIDSPYSQLLKNLSPKYLIEIHGHGSGKANFDVEISAGNFKDNQWSLLLAKNLNNKLEGAPVLNKLNISGDFNKIYFKATKTVTIQYDGWLGIHIELPLKLRREKNYTQLPLIGKQFTQCLAVSINKTLRI